jgi:hypothetical protein
MHMRSYKSNLYYLFEFIIFAFGMLSFNLLF